MQVFKKHHTTLCNVLQTDVASFDGSSNSINEKFFSKENRRFVGILKIENFLWEKNKIQFLGFVA